MNKHYIDVCQRTIQFIDKQIEKDMSLDTIALAVYCSKYHLSRIFCAVTGSTINHYVTQLRLNKAANQLVYRAELSITEIGFQARFANSESFSRAFKRVFNQTPSDYRVNPIEKPWLKFDPIIKECPMTPQKEAINVEIVNLDDIHLAVLTHKGHPNTLHSTLNTFIAWRRANKLPPNKSRTFNLFHQDPSQVTPDAFSVDVAAQTPENFTLNSDEMFKTTIPAGRYAKLRHTGKESLLPQAIQRFYQDWLIDSNEVPLDFPLILERITLFPDVEANENIVDIFIALR